MKGIYRERVKGRGIERDSERKKIERKRRFLLQFLNKEIKSKQRLITRNYCNIE